MSNDKFEPTIGDEIVPEVNQEPKVEEKLDRLMYDVELQEQIEASLANIHLFKEYVNRQEEAQSKRNLEQWIREWISGPRRTLRILHWLNRWLVKVRRNQELIGRTGPRTITGFS